MYCTIICLPFAFKGSRKNDQPGNDNALYFLVQNISSDNCLTYKWQSYSYMVTVYIILYAYGSCSLLNNMVFKGLSSFAVWLILHKIQDIQIKITVLIANVIRPCQLSTLYYTVGDCRWVFSCSCDSKVFIIYYYWNKCHSSLFMLSTIYSVKHILHVLV